MTGNLVYLPIIKSYFCIRIDWLTKKDPIKSLASSMYAVRCIKGVIRQIAKAKIANNTLGMVVFVQAAAIAWREEAL